MSCVLDFADTDRVEAKTTAFIRSHLPEVVLVENLSSELIYQLPDDSASVGKFERLFVDLDSSLSELGISGYGISNTSLEEVCLLRGVTSYGYTLCCNKIHMLTCLRFCHLTCSHLYINN